VGFGWFGFLRPPLAEQGRTVFVSSHLLAEMANTADQLVVIGRGKLIAATSMSEFLSRSGVDTVRVRSPQTGPLRDVLSAAGLRVGGDDSALLVSGGTPEQVGELAAGNSITLHELSVQRASLEEAYMKLTDDSVEYRASGVTS
jgi:ABC-2 type transport system ATP-binding protein